MKRQISIREGSVERTARWIYANNTCLWNRHNISVETLKDDIQRSIDRVIKYAEKDWTLNYSGTAGFTVFFMPEDESYGTVEVLVDPAVGGEYEFEIIWEGN